MHIEYDVSLFPLGPKRTRLNEIAVDGRIDLVYLIKLERIGYNYINQSIIDF